MGKKTAKNYYNLSDNRASIQDSVPMVASGCPILKLCAVEENGWLSRRRKL